MTFDDFGHRFICYNRVQVQHVVLPGRYLRRNPHLAATTHGAGLPGRHGGRAAGRARGGGPALSDQQEHHHGRFARRHVHGRLRRVDLSLQRTARRRIAAARFPAIRRATWFISTRWSRPGRRSSPGGRAEPSEFLASPRRLVPAGAIWPQGPDGALYVCDMYRKTIEHPDYLPPEIRKHTDFESGKGMGRIWRVVGRRRCRRSRSRAICQVLADVAGRQDCAMQLRQPDALVARHGPPAAAWSVVRTRQQSCRPAWPPVARTYAAGRAPWPAIARRLRRARSARCCPSSFGHASPGRARAGDPACRAAAGKDRPSSSRQVAALAGDPDARVRFQCASDAGRRSTIRRCSGRWSNRAGRQRRSLDAAGGATARSAAASSNFLPPFAASRAGNRRRPASGGTQLLAELGQLIGASQPPADWPRRCTRSWRRSARGRFRIRRPASSVCRKPCGCGGGCVGSALQAVVAGRLVRRSDGRSALFRRACWPRR